MSEISIEEKYKEALILLEEARLMLREYTPLPYKYNEMQRMVWEQENKWHNLMTRLNQYCLINDLYWENKQKAEATDE